MSLSLHFFDTQFGNRSSWPTGWCLYCPHATDKSNSYEALYQHALEELHVVAKRFIIFTGTMERNNIETKNVTTNSETCLSAHNLHISSQRNKNLHSMWTLTIDDHTCHDEVRTIQISWRISWEVVSQIIHCQLQGTVVTKEVPTRCVTSIEIV